MSRAWRIGRVAILCTGILLLVVAGGWFWFVHSFHLNISRSDTRPLEMALKEAASNLVVAKRPDSIPDTPSGGYLVAYQRSPDGFRGDANLFDTWMASMKLATASLKGTSRGNWVRSSADADYIALQDRLDPWHHTFCLLRRDDELLVVSGGPNAPGSPACRDIQLQAEDVAKLPHGKLLESPAGYLILVIDKANADWQTR